MKDITNEQKYHQVTHHLRSEPLTVSEKEAQTAFKTEQPVWWSFTTSTWQPLTYIQHEHEDQGKVVNDHATGLMWQKSGSPDTMKYQKAQAYITQLNHDRFAGYSDWRLPTMPELMTLLEPTKKNGDLYSDPVFDHTQRWHWSADKSSPGSVWVS